MELWTYQDKGFSPVEMHLDHQKSGNYKRYFKQYHLLWEKLGTKQILWCVNNPERMIYKWGYTEWFLDVPETKFLAIINSSVWNGAILGEEYRNSLLYDELMCEARKLGLEDPKELVDYVENKMERLRKPEGDPWEALFLDDPRGVDSTILLETKIPQTWVIETNNKPLKSKHLAKLSKRDDTSCEK